MIIDPEFASICPPLTAEEYQNLEINIIKDGCLDALVLWESMDILLDGHNRFRICIANSIKYNTISISLPNREAAINWIILNQLGRRNLHPDAASLLRGKLYNSQKKAAGGRADRDFSGDHFDTPKTADRLSSQLGVSAPTIKRDGQFAKAVATIAPFMPDLPQMVMSGSAPPRQAIIEAAKTPEKATHQLISQSNSNEWYTPPEYIESARNVMGIIDLDPASNDVAQGWIKAKLFYTSSDSGLDHEWNGKVWLNPPYGQFAGAFVTKLVTEMERGGVNEAIVLVNSHATDTLWFAPLWQGLLCFTNHRINFQKPDTDVTTGSTHGSVFVYFGTHETEFIREFSQWGTIVRKVTCVN